MAVQASEWVALVLVSAEPASELEGPESLSAELASPLEGLAWE